MSARYKVMRGCKCFISAKYMNELLLSWKLKYQIQNDQNRRSGKKENCIYETYKNTVMPNGRHIYAKAFDVESIQCVHILRLIMHFHTENV